MSGIFGVIQLGERPVDAAELARMGEAMAYRGPDGVATLDCGRAVLGHLASHTAPAARTGPQPLHDARYGLAITADARLDNRDDLCRGLGIPATEAAGTPDSRLILEAYRKWGVACAEHLLGDFAFALWDTVQRRLVCGRDHLGLRPLYYFHGRDILVFASSARAILRVGGVPAVIDRGRVADFLVWELEGINTTCSFFEGIHRLPPAHTAVLQDGALSLRRYWHPDAETELKLGSDDEYLEMFGGIFRRAVGDRLVSRVPVASMLSGGLDSSTIVGVGRDLLESSQSVPLVTFSAVADDPGECAESGFVRKVVGHGGVQSHHVVPAGPGARVRELPGVLRLMEEPWDSMESMLMLIYLAAGERGHDVLLDGVDGDLVAALPESYTAVLFRQGRFFRAWYEFRRQCKNYHRTDVSLLRYAGMLRSALTPPVLRGLRNRWSGPAGSADRLTKSLISSEFAREVRLGERFAEHRHSTHTPGWISLRQACVDRVLAPYLTAAVERYGRVAAVCGLEHRKPFLDKRLVEFCLALPWDQKNRDGWSKFIVRRLAETVLPAEVAWRRGWDHVAWRFNEAVLQFNRADILDSLHRNRTRLVEWVDAEKFARLLDDYRDGTGASGQQVRMLYALATWLERHARG